jgi:hypothetical protein
MFPYNYNKITLHDDVLPTRSLYRLPQEKPNNKQNSTTATPKAEPKMCELENINVF